MFHIHRKDSEIAESAIKDSIVYNIDERAHLEEQNRVNYNTMSHIEHEEPEIAGSVIKITEDNATHVASGEESTLNPLAKPFVSPTYFQEEILNFSMGALDEELFECLDDERQTKRAYDFEPFNAPIELLMSTPTLASEFYDYFMTLSPGEQDLLAPDWNPRESIAHQVKDWATTPWEPWLRLKGWPKEAIKILRRKKKVFTSGKSQKYSRSKDYHLPRLASKSTVWRIPITPVSRVPKPTHYEHSSFTRWVLGEAKFHSELLMSPKEYVTGNSNCMALYYGAKEVSTQRRAMFLLNTSVFIDTFTPNNWEPKPLLFKVTDVPEIEIKLNTILGDLVTPLRLGSMALTPENILPLQDTIFKKNKPAYRMCLAYFNEPLLVDRVRLQNSLDQIMGPCNEPAVCAVSDFFPPLRHKEPVLAPPLRSTKCIVYQGGVVSKAVSGFKVEHEVNIHFQPNSIPSLVESMGVSPDKVQKFIRYTSVLFAVITSNSWSNLLAIITSFVSSDTKLYNALKERVMSLEQLPTFAFQGPEFLKGISATIRNYVWNIMVEIGLVTLIEETLPNLSTLIVPTLRSLIEGCKKQIHLEASKKIADSIILWISEIFNRIKTAITTGSISPLWGPKWDPRVWIFEADSSRMYFTQLTIQGASNISSVNELTKLRLSKSISAKWVVPVTVDEFMRITHDHIVQGRELIRYFAGYPAIVADLTRSLTSLTSFVSTLHIISTSVTERVCPIMIYLYGPPGVGKSNLCQQILKGIASKNSYPMDSSGVYNWVPTANFQDGFLHTHWAVIMDDVDQGVAQPTAGLRSHVEEVIALVNNNRYPVEAADISLKGKIQASPLVLIYCSNYPGGNAEDYTREPQAFYRRITFHATVGVKPEFAIDGMIDKDLASKANTHELYTLSVSEYKKPSSGSLVFLTPAKTYTLSGFMNLILRRFEKQLEIEITRLSQRACNPGFCPTCALDTSRECGCIRDEGTLDLQAFDFRRDPILSSMPQSVSVDRTAARELEDFQCELFAMLHNYITSHGFSDDELEDPRWTPYTSALARVTNMDEANSLRFLDPSEIIIRERTGFVPRTRSLHPLTFLPSSLIVPFLVRRFNGLVQGFSLTDEEVSDPSLGIYMRALLRVTDRASYAEAETLSPFVPILARRMRSGMRFQSSHLVAGGVAAVSLGYLISKRWFARTMSYEIGLINRKLLLAGSGVLLASAALYIMSHSVEVYQSREQNVMGGVVPVDWFRANQEFKPTLPGFGQTTFSKEDLFKVMEESYCTVTGDNQIVHGTVLSNSCVLVPTHILYKDYGEPSLKLLSEVVIEQNGTKLNCSLSPLSVVAMPSNIELSVVRVNGLRGGHGSLKKMMMSQDESIQSFDELLICGKSSKYSPSSNSVRTMGPTRVLTTNANTQNGDCGLLYLGRHNNHWKIVGMHYAYNNVGILGNGFSVGALVSILELQSIIKTLGVSGDSVVLHLQSLGKEPSKVQVSAYDKKSEVWAAITYGTIVHNLGQLSPPLSGSNMKTKVQESLFAEDVRDLELEFCGQLHYWMLPTFVGKMVHGQWKSPYTEMFMTQNHKDADATLLMLALCDYAQGINSLDCGGYSVLSEESVLTGLNNSYIHSVNMQTSVGPPYNMNKKHFIVLDRINGSSMDQKIWSMIDSLESILENDIPSVLGLCTLKDEALKPNKYPRVFVCLPFAINFVMKKYGSGWKSLVRANFQFFESAVGINMTSSECNKVVSKMRSVDPLLTNLYDGDIKAMDKSWSADLYNVVCLMVFILSSAIGVEPMKNYRLAQSMKHTTYSIKNDLFRANMNPSGNDWTVELNSLAMSIMERYVYYREHPFTGDLELVRDWYKGIFDNPIPPFISGLNFRENVALVTYGDDNLKACRFPLTPNYMSIWRDELGMVMTPADKGDTFKPQKLEEVSFLKRKFVWDAELRQYVPPLDMRSIMRMLLIKKDSVLTVVDHAGVALSEVQRESVYHGEAMFNRLRKLTTFLATKYNLDKNPNYVDRDYEHYRKLMREGSFQTWETRTVRAPPPVLEEHTHLIYQMNHLSLAKPTESSESNTQTILHDTGDIAAAFSMSTANNPHIYTQTFPKTDLGDFLKRATNIATGTFTSIDSSNSILTTIVPWTSFLANTTIAEKVKNFTYIRGTLQVIMVVNVPGACYGRYALSALPQAGTDPTSSIATNLAFENIFQVDHYAQIDMSTSQSVVLQLPFCFPYDYACISAGVGPAIGPTWDIYISCLSPVKQAGAVAGASATYQIYANCLDDLELVVPRFQSRKLKANAAMKQHAPKIYNAIGEGKGSQIAGAIASAAESLQKVPIISGVASSVAMGARGAEELLSWFGFTRENSEVVPIPVTSRSVTNVARVNGGDGSDMAALMLENSISSDPAYSGGGPEDCTAFADIANRWTYSGSFIWAQSDPVYDSIFSIPVTPFWSTAFAPEIRITSAGFCGLPFSYWRGDLEYKFVIPASSFHRGVLQFIWVPLGSSLPITDVTNVALNQIVEISPNKDINITVGFARDQPFLQNVVTCADTVIVAYGTYNGYLHVRVVNPLQSMGNDPLKITVFARCKNMEFAVPRDTFRWQGEDGVATTVNLMEGLVLQAGALGDAPALEEDNLVLVEESAPIPSDQLFFGEAIRSARAMMQKPSRINQVTSIVGATQNSMLGPPSEGGVGFTHAGYYASMFVGIAASSRIKIFVKTPSWIGASKSLTINATVPTTAPMTYSGSQLGAEFVVPYYEPKTFLRPWSVSNDGLALVKVVVRQADNTAASTFIEYYSLGPDIRVAGFRQTPGINVRVTPLPSVTTWW